MMRKTNTRRREARLTIVVAVATLILAVLPACTSGGRLTVPPRPATVEANRGAVASPSIIASRIGVRVMRDGGNAVDASVAVAFAMAVTWPEAGNIGGGGFMLIAPRDGEPLVVDYRETAPAAATPDMYTLGESVHTAKAVGVPGTVRGLAMAHDKFGRLPWKRLIAPAVELADEGFTLDAGLAQSLNRIIARSPDHAELRRVYGRADGRPWRDGDQLLQPDLAQTLRAIAQRGADGFYKGEVAQLIVSEMQRGNGIITLGDLSAYESKLREPIHTTYRGADVYGPPPPSSGGITLALMLNMLEPYNLREYDRFSPRTMHLMIEAQRRAYLERARHLGDSDFVDIPDRLTTKSFARELAGDIDLDRASSSEALAGDMAIAPGGDSTTHFSVIDADGLAVSNTYTLEQSYGSRIVVRGGGFLLNNEMGDFNWKRGHTDRRGRIGTDANLIAPGKRMLSSMTPIIVKRDGRVVLVTGSPGGRTIINTGLCIVLNVLEYDMSVADAVQAPRLHHQWLPDMVSYEASEQPGYTRTLDALRTMGHHLAPNPHIQGSANSIGVDPQSAERTAVGDRRRSRAGGAAGY